MYIRDPEGIPASVMTSREGILQGITTYSRAAAAAAAVATGTVAAASVAVGSGGCTNPASQWD